jgi:hypothetical protein
MAVKKLYEKYQYIHHLHHFRFRPGCNGDPWQLEAIVQNPLEYLKWSGAQRKGRSRWGVLNKLSGKGLVVRCVRGTLRYNGSIHRGGMGRQIFKL